MYVLFFVRGEKVSSINIQAAMRGVTKALHEAGYIDDTRKRTLLYQIETGDTEVNSVIRKYLIQIADQLN